MKNRISLSDYIMAVVFVFASLSLLSYIGGMLQSDVLNPIEKAFGDFELTDVVFSHLRERPGADTNIVLVNIGDLDRAGIAEEIEIINQYKPKVIGIDAFFRNPKGRNQEGIDVDSALAAAFSKVENLVLVSKVNQYNEQTGKHDTLEISNPMFTRYAMSGMSNMISEGYDVFKTSRTFSTQEKVKDTTEIAFAVKLAGIYNPKAMEKFMARGKETEIINFQGNFDPKVNEKAANARNVFTALDINDVFNENFNPDVIKGKIILMGYMGPSWDKITWEDKFFTPLNKIYIGKTNPDMYGVVVHANIISMILRGSFIDEMPVNIDYWLNIVLILINIYFFYWLLLNTGIWWDGISMLVTLAQVLVLIGIVVYVFNGYNYKFDITYSLVALFLIANLLEIYYNIIKPLYRRIKKRYLYLQRLKTSKAL